MCWMVVSPQQQCSINCSTVELRKFNRAFVCAAIDRARHRRRDTVTWLLVLVWIMTNEHHHHHRPHTHNWLHRQRIHTSRNEIHFTYTLSADKAGLHAIRRRHNFSLPSVCFQLWVSQHTHRLVRGPRHFVTFFR